MLVRDVSISSIYTQEWKPFTVVRGFNLHAPIADRKTKACREFNDQFIMLIICYRVAKWGPFC